MDRPKAQRQVTAILTEEQMQWFEERRAAHGGVSTAYMLRKVVDFARLSPRAFAAEVAQSSRPSLVDAIVTLVGMPPGLAVLVGKNGRFSAVDTETGEPVAGAVELVGDGTVKFSPEQPPPVSEGTPRAFGFNEGRP